MLRDTVVGTSSLKFQLWRTAFESNFWFFDFQPLTSLSPMTVALVDFSAHKTPQALASEIANALTTVGFLFLSNHGLESAVQRMFALSSGYFFLS